MDCLGAKTGPKSIATQSDVSMTAICNAIMPVGYIYTSADSTSPATLFGGTWTQIKDTFLLAAGDTYTAGTTGGEATVLLDTTMIPAHSHSFAAWTGGGGSHTHDVSGTAASAGNHTHGVSGTAASAGAHTHTYDKMWTQSGGSSQLASGAAGYSLVFNQGISTGSAGAHTHGVSGTAASAGAHTHTVSGSAASAGNHDHYVSGPTANTGGGLAHDNMPPYKVMYVWQRTALAAL